MEPQQNQKEQNRPNQNLNTLEKILKLDRKNTNFDFVDDLHSTKLKIKYTQGNPNNITGTNKNQQVLRTYWRHVNNFYFKKIEQAQLNRLDYLNLMLNSEIKETQHIYFNTQAYLAIDEVLNPSYFLSEFPASIQTMNYQNMLRHYYIQEAYNQCLLKNTNKKLINKIRGFNKQKNFLLSKGNLNQNELRRQEQKLTQMMYLINKDLLNQQQQNDEITELIMNKQKELKQQNIKNLQIVNDLKTKIHFELKNKSMLFYVNKKEDLANFDFKNSKLKNQIGIFNSIDRIDLQVKYLTNLILRLEKKQVAQSISKVLSTQKTRNSYKFIVTFEQALNINEYTFSQSQFTQLNNLRQNSLLKFYNISLKSMFTNISHNFVGFGHIYKRRNLVNQYKDKNQLDLMKRVQKQSNEVMQAMEKFEMCHHCKQLLHIKYLIKCNYRSSKMGFPVSNPTSSDSNFIQFLQFDSITNTNRSLVNRKKNSYMTYTKKGSQYICQRKYCKTCIKQNYDSIQKNGLCAFCQGVCFCTRCLRNDMITKLKTIFSSFGGDINLLHSQSLFQQLVAKSTTYDKDEIYSGGNRTQKRKGRPKRNTPSLITKPSGKSFQKLRDLKQQMGQCSVICHLVKKREKQKLQLIQHKSDLFQKKLEIIDEKNNILKRSHHDFQKQTEATENFNSKKKKRSTPITLDKIRKCRKTK